MIFGYYCVHPELVDEIPAVARSRNRLAFFEKANVGAIIDKERSIYNERKAIYSDISCLRASIGKLYEDGQEQCILSNYKVVLDDLGFDPIVAYSGVSDSFDFDKGDYFEPVSRMSDDEVVTFFAYMEKKFDKFHEKYCETIRNDRNLFVSRVIEKIKSGHYPSYVSDRLVRLERTAIEFDDGHRTTLEGISGWYRPQSNLIMLSASGYLDNDSNLLFHECYHVIEGRSITGNGLQRLKSFFDKKYAKTIERINEVFVNYKSSSLLNNDLRLGQKNRCTDQEIVLYILVCGEPEIPVNMLYNAYFSDDMRDVEALADAIKQSFDSDILFQGLGQRICPTAEISFMM